MISAKVITDSTHGGARVTTFELEYPRFIHSEFMTHRVFSRNCASSRAIPIDAAIKLVRDNPAMPIHWGKNQPGMQANEELTEVELQAAKDLWIYAMDNACLWSKALANTGLHKQIANRVSEPFQTMKTVVTATEWDNFFELRNHKDAQPEIHELAFLMAIQMRNSNPIELGIGEWHLPYVTESSGDLANDLMISASCCAQVSYRKSDDSLEKAKAIFDKLISMRPRHSSPFEHQATPVDYLEHGNWPAGVTHIDKDYRYWSGNFRDWVQYRQLL